METWNSGCHSCPALGITGWTQKHWTSRQHICPSLIYWHEFTFQTISTVFANVTFSRGQCGNPVTHVPPSPQSSPLTDHFSPPPSTTPSLFPLCLCFAPPYRSSVFVSLYINSVIVTSGMCINCDLPYLPSALLSLPVLHPPPLPRPHSPGFLIHPCLPPLRPLNPALLPSVSTHPDL